MHGNGRRLSPQEIAERFGAQKREHEAGEKRRRDYRNRKLSLASAREYLKTQGNETVSGSMSEGLKALSGMRCPQGRFIGVKSS